MISKLETSFGSKSDKIMSAIHECCTDSLTELKVNNSEGIELDEIDVPFSKIENLQIDDGSFKNQSNFGFFRNLSQAS